MLPTSLILIAVTVRFFGSLAYAWAVIKGRAKPNPVSWFFWAITALIVFFAQINSGVGWSALVSFVLGVGPLIVFGLSLKYSIERSQFTPSTRVCGLLASLGVVLWLSTNDPILAIFFSIFADISASLPTVLKAYRQPKSEVVFPYALSVFSMGLTLVGLTDWRVSSFIFPAYILAINAVIIASLLAGRAKAAPVVTRPRKALRSKQA